VPTQETTGSSPEAEPTGAIQSASEMKAGDRVVYPKQGVCRVLGLESKEIAGQRLEFVSMSREEDNATILVPVPKVASIGLRKVADTVELADVFDLLASSFDDPELDWKVRHRLHGDLLAAGGILGVAEVLKALQGLANLRPLPQKERERYDMARHLLVAEVTVALGVPPATAEDFIDLALLPPPGTVRPASKPRRLAVVTPRPKPFARARPRAEGEEEEELGLEDELGFEEEEEEAVGPEVEGAEEHEGEAEEEAPKAAAPARAKKPTRAKAPAKPKAKTAAPASAAEAKPKAGAAKKAAPSGEETAPETIAAEEAKPKAKAAAAKKAAPATKEEAPKAGAVKKAAPAAEEATPKARAAKKAEPAAEAEGKPSRKGATTTKKAAPESGTAAARKASAKKAAPAAKAAPKGAAKKRKSGEEA